MNWDCEDMQLEPNLFFKQGDGKVSAAGIHDESGSCFILKAGSQGSLCENPRRVFMTYPELKTFYEREISPLEQRTSAGDDVHYYLRKDLHCYPCDDRDELSVAASIMAGKLMPGSTSWRNADGKSVKTLKSKNVEVSIDDADSNNPRYELAAQATFDMLRVKKPLIKVILSFAYHLSNALGTKNEDRFVIPRQVDHAMVKFGFECVETDAYDLLIPGEEFTISDKMGNSLFHQLTSQKPKSSTLGQIMMSNVRSGQDSSNHQRPQFDCLLAMQYKPFLVCGVSPYSKIQKRFRKTDGGYMLSKVPVDAFQYVLSPTESIPPNPLSKEAEDELYAFVNLVQGGFLPSLIDKHFQLDNFIETCDNTPKEIW